MPSPSIRQTQSGQLKQTQHLMATEQMQQAIHLLQMPIMELTQAIEAEMEQNPLLEYSENTDHEEFEEIPERSLEEELTFTDKDLRVLSQLEDDFHDLYNQTVSTYEMSSQEDEKLKNFLDSSIKKTLSLFEHLMNQARETFDDQQKLSMAEAIIGNLEESGLLTTPLKEISLLSGHSIDDLSQVLKVIQTFSPHGIAAKNIQESFLVQLKCQKKQDSLAFEIIEKHFDELMNNKILMIKKSLKTTSNEISEAIDTVIAKLNFHPASPFDKRESQAIIPDAAIVLEEGALIVRINDDTLPPLRLNSIYLRMLRDENTTDEAKEYIKQKIGSAKWLLKNIHQRNDTIERISKVIAEKQKNFLLHEHGKLEPMTMKQVADELELHESTIARTVSRKYINTPRGIFLMRFFFTNAIATEGDDISSTTVKTMLLDLIANEDKRHPLSDQSISDKITAKGIECARRTVAKYRIALKIGSSQKRRKFS